MLLVDWVQWVQPLDREPVAFVVEPEVRMVRRAGVEVARQFVVTGSMLRGVREEATALVLGGDVPGLTRVDWFLDLPVGSTVHLAESLRRGTVSLRGARGFRVFEEYRGGRVGRTVCFGHSKSLIRVYCGTLLEREAERIERQTRGEFLRDALDAVRGGRYSDAISGPVEVGGLVLLEFLWRSNVSGRRD